MSQPTGAQLDRILVVKLAGIGDLLTAFPALEALRHRYPRAEITALVTPQTTGMLDDGALVDRVIPLDKYLFDDPTGFLTRRGITGLRDLALDLRSRSFDAAILLHHLQSWQGVAKYGLMMLASGAKLRVGLDDGRGRFFNLKVRDEGFGARHEVEYWTSVVGLLGAACGSPELRMVWGDEEEAFASATWAGLGFGEGSRVAALHPGTGSYSPVRRWSARGFSRVGDALRSDGLTPLIVVGPGEEGLARWVAEGMEGPVALLKGVPGPRHLAAVLSRCSLFVGSDSGVMHVATAAGIPVVAVFGPSNHRAWGPYDPAGERSRVVRLGLACSPCMYRGQSLGMRYGCGTMQCLRGITPEMVLSAARELLGDR